MTMSTPIQDPEAPPRPVRVMVVDDHEQYRSLVASVIGVADGFEFAGQAASLVEAVEAVESADEPADLVLLDVNLGDDNGTDVSRAIRSIAPTVQIVLISTLARDELPPDAPECGARGFLSKSKVSPTALGEAWAGAYDW